MTSDPLAQLRDIHLPPPVSWWPLAPGWYIVLALLVVVGLVLGYWRWRRYQRRRVVRLMVARLAQLAAIPSQAALIELATLLRRCALTYYPREQVAGLQGDAWLVFLDTTGNTTAFSQGIGRVLITAPYEIHSDVDRAALSELILAWVKQQAEKKP